MQVGETGTGKTTVCQLYSVLLARKLCILNCHQNTETADFLGGLRPVRGELLIVDNSFHMWTPLLTFIILSKKYNQIGAFFVDTTPFVRTESPEIECICRSITIDRCCDEL